jgi:hypothetical protein
VGSDDEGAGPSSAHQQPQQPQQQSSGDWRSRLRPPGGSRGRAPAVAAEAAARRELLGPAGTAPGAPQPHAASPMASALVGCSSGGGTTRVRTAAEIRAAYGRPALHSENAAAASLGGAMAETRSALAERGEKLRALQDKGSDLEESAATFAELAKQMAERERAKAKFFGFGLG